jgi:hypothetical protein
VALPYRFLVIMSCKYQNKMRLSNLICQTQVIVGRNEDGE